MASLVLLGALCRGESPEAFADSIGDRGAAALKAAVTEAVNEHLRALRRRRLELAADPTVVRDLLRRGDDRANALAGATLHRVREAMRMT